MSRAVILCFMLLFGCGGSQVSNARHHDDGFRKKLSAGCQSVDDCDRLVFEAHHRLKHCAEEEESEGAVPCRDARADVERAEDVQYKQMKQTWAVTKSRAAARRVKEEAAANEERERAKADERRIEDERAARAAREEAAKVAAAAREEAAERARLDEERKQEAARRAAACTARRQGKCSADCQGNQACMSKCLQKGSPCN